ncbi:hypothetical protein GDO86_013176 [Hymenochirus boettgeri]|uniref:Protein transport protein Sec31A n=1 Tax=Hymenochirus boettgeri TaxID=247094 RepID=A0A8T2IVN5_9PIPI|nr:hypothetical protein GDO86_013176 [Hymenochirus boettgeri]
MKLKEIERSAVQVWSPASQHPIYLATGTSAQQLDASFNTNAALEIFEVDFGDPHPDVKRRGAYPVPSRFHKILWASFESDSSQCSGVIIGGGDNGAITLYSASEILTSGDEPVIAKNDKHCGPVGALDLNPFQNNLLASGANDSEVFIWDLNNFTVPMTPGAKSQPIEDISAVSWNRQVQHILSSAHRSGKAVVWDLRKNEPVIKVSDHSNRMHCSGMAWHPEIPTQLVLASEDDRLPVIQVWDLRFASSPLKMLESHTRGILSISWSKDDPELLLSSAKDNRILCWNPATSEVVYELPTKNQWCFDVQWCPRNPSVFSAASFDGWINVYSVMGGNLEAQQRCQADKISLSFNNLDPFGTGQPLPPLEVPQQVAQTTVIPPLKKPPRWIRRPVGVSFAFGGKLACFHSPKTSVQPTPEPSPQQVYISQVTTEREFLVRSSELQSALLSGNLLSYCQNKVQSSQNAYDKNIWNFLKVNFEQDAREKFLKLLGYSKEELAKKISNILGESWQLKSSPSEPEDLIQSIHSASSQGSSSFTGHTLSTSSSMEFFNLLPQDPAKFDIPVTSDIDGLISQALLLGNFEAAVDLCLKDGRFADAIILANAGGEDLLRETQQWYFAHQKNKISSLLSSVVHHKWRDIVVNCNLQSWKEALALLLTYSKPEEYAELCDVLGSRLETECEGKLSSQACLCYISSGNVDRLVEYWVRSHDTSTPLTLQNAVCQLRDRLLNAQGGDQTAMSHQSTIQPPVTSKGSKATEALHYSDGGTQSFPQHGTRTTPMPSVPSSVYMSQHAAAVGPLPAVPLHSIQAPPSNAFPRSATWQPFTASQPAVQAFVHPSSFKQPSHPVQPPLGFPSSPVTGQLPPIGPVNIPGLSTSFGPISYPPASIPSSIPPTVQPASRTIQPMGQPPTPPSAHAPFDYPMGTGYYHGGPGAPTSLPPPPTASEQESWTDPLSFKASIQRKKSNPIFPPAPITSPVMNLPSEQENMYPQLGSCDLSQAPPGAPKEAGMQRMHRLHEKIEKKEIPPQHQPLQKTFDGLVQSCLAVSSDPKTKRKLDDALQRLECLYDKLRENSLSPPILAGLHEIAHCIETRNYHQGLAVHTHVVSSSNFSEVSGFMPMLKVLMTIASKLGV